MDQFATNKTAINECNASVTGAPFDRDGAIRRYQQIQQEIACLEKERECLRDLLVKELEGKVPAVRSGLFAISDFRGAFRKVVTPYLSIRSRKA